MKKKINVFILGNEGVGWSIDKDRENIEKFISELKYKITKNIFRSNIIYCVWWNVAYKYRFLLKILNKKLIVTLTNNIADKRLEINKLKPIVHIWICANEKQKMELIEFGVKESKIRLIPFYVNEDSFKREKKDKKMLCNELGVKYQDINGKLLIGSFQRDTQNTDLLKPRWQKDPDLLIDIVKDMDKEKYCLILAGPGRHYLIKQCRKLKIPYVYVGNESYIDRMENDLTQNIQNENTINCLYNLIDIYIVTSKSEGGPKAILEASLAETMIISTDVGMASDILNSDCIYSNYKEARKMINYILEESKIFNTENIKHYNFNNAHAKNNYQNRKQVINSMLKELFHDE